jgi:hypothetical protein
VIYAVLAASAFLALGLVDAPTIVAAAAHHHAAVAARPTVAVAIIIAVGVTVLVTTLIVIALAVPDGARHTQGRIARRWHLRLAGDAGVNWSFIVSLLIITFVAFTVVALAAARDLSRARAGCAQRANQTEVDRRPISNFCPNEVLAVRAP